MAVIDHEKLRQYADFFSERALKASRYLDRKFPDQTTYDFRSGVDFHAGFVLMEEGYKNAAAWKQKQYLHLSSWDDKAIEAGIVAKEILALIYDDELDNLIDWRDKDDFKTLLEDESKRILLGDCLRGIFCGNNDMKSFQHAQNCIGNKFPIISYMFFVKNPEKYLPVRPDTFSDRFQTVGINGWKRGCSWDNFKDFISAIEEVQIFLMEYFHDESISLLDAHSFVWMAWMDKFSEKDYLVKIEQHCRIELGKKQKKYDTQEGCVEEAERIEAELSSLKGEEREAVVKLRVNQGVFRNLLLEKYKHCCLCQVSNRGLLSASHIKPWSASTSEEKLDRNNGFLMCPNHDRLFDKGFISFKDDGSIMISEHLSETDRIFTNVRPNMSIELTEGNKRYLRYHRDNVYRGN